MNGQVKFPRGQGRPISVKRAKAEQKRWKNNPRNKVYPSDTFAIPMEFLTKFISNPVCNGVKFCNGLNENGEYSPAMCTITGEGEIVEAFDASGVISTEEFEKCRANWARKFPVENGYIQFFYLGEEAIKANIEDFEVGRYEAAFVEDRNGQDTALLYGFSSDGMKDPGDDDPDTALNRAYICPPFCEGN